ncbi:DUF4060 family protein [Serratia fonticola]|uniref:DUF4060 family protein n=1 Tax=Serratia fonticola TaxID=47917 RepID=UPI003AAAD6C0
MTNYNLASAGFFYCLKVPNYAHIIRGNPSLLERQAALSAHQSRYGGYGRRKVSESYRVQVSTTCAV